MRAKVEREGEAGAPLKRIDYVLIYRPTADAATSTMRDRKALRKRESRRARFEGLLAEQGVEFDHRQIGSNVFLLLHFPFRRLCAEAERMQLEMPLDGCEIYDDGPEGCLSRFIRSRFETDDEVDFVSAAYQQDKHHIFHDSDRPDKFFRPAIRSLLAHHIMINMDIRTKTNEDKDDDPLSKKGLPYLLMKGVFTDSLTLHDETLQDPAVVEALMDTLRAEGRPDDLESALGRSAQRAQLAGEDTRRRLDETWCRPCAWQPLWRVRNYFGEKIALYFAWSGALVGSLWAPSLLGLAIFVYGLVHSVTHKPPVAGRRAANGSFGATDAQQSQAVLERAFDNSLTPVFAIVICLWGTIFLEVWKRKNATLAYEWDVDNFEDTEPDRPQFYGTEKKPDPVTREETGYYPKTQQCVKFAASASVLIMMVCMVCISAMAIIVYRVIMSVRYCEQLGTTGCLVVTTVLSSIFNAISIMILGKLYEKLAYKLTDWENHRTQTQYNDALILKLFAFQFANSYTSLFYIAFFQGIDYENGILGLGSGYVDTCGDDNNCMHQLSIQVLILMLMKPVPKFCKDVIIPFVRRLFRRFCRSRRVSQNPQKLLEVESFLERERQKACLGDFTMAEFTEKVIVYGYLVLFSASLPIAPMLVLLVNLVDIRVDAKRMLWLYRRPLSIIAQDIGMWQNILQCLNVLGVVSNAFLIAFTSSWSNDFSMQKRLLVVIVFEHAVFAFKLIARITIPDYPADIKLAIKRERYQVRRIMEQAAVDLHQQHQPHQQHQHDFLDTAEENESGRLRKRSERASDATQRHQAEKLEVLGVPIRYHQQNSQNASNRCPNLPIRKSGRESERLANFRNSSNFPPPYPSIPAQSPANYPQLDPAIPIQSPLYSKLATKDLNSGNRFDDHELNLRKSKRRSGDRKLHRRDRDGHEDHGHEDQRYERGDQEDEDRGYEHGDRRYEHGDQEDEDRRYEHEDRRYEHGDRRYEHGDRRYEHGDRGDGHDDDVAAEARLSSDSEILIPSWTARDDDESGERGERRE